MNVVRLVKTYVLLGIRAHVSHIWKPMDAALGTAVFVLTLKISAPVLDVSALVCALVAVHAACMALFGLEEDDQSILLQF